MLHTIPISSLFVLNWENLESRRLWEDYNTSVQRGGSYARCLQNSPNPAAYRGGRHLAPRYMYCVYRTMQAVLLRQRRRHHFFCMTGILSGGKLGNKAGNAYGSTGGVGFGEGSAAFLPPDLLPPEEADFVVDFVTGFLYFIVL